MDGVQYEFSGKPYFLANGEMACGWVFVALPKELSVEIRANFKGLEQGWGRMKVTAKIGNTAWAASIWFDTKADTYLLSLPAAIRKKEKVTTDAAISVTLTI